MHILCSNEELVFNFELLELLRQRSRGPGLISYSPQPREPLSTELKCYDALRKSAAVSQTKTTVSSFFCAVKHLVLTPMEFIHVVNLKAISVVDFHLLVGEYGNRFTSQEAADLPSTVCRLL
mmetsp:Transcript_4850/g.17358  ORF Transcript_4850/g.17358 Transcript_4850/m.17358 type:complete len:122 (+) Transcript_4850:275-640(+)